MTEYALYLESGPKHKKTMVHVLDCLGCIAKGTTTETALKSTPQAIRLWLRFLQKHGEGVDPEEEFTTQVTAHVTEGTWIGYGDPTPGFPPDFEPLTMEGKVMHTRHLAWLLADLLGLASDLPLAQLLEEPKSRGRSIYCILEHVAESQVIYLRYLVGKTASIAEALRTVQDGPVEFLLPNLSDLWQVTRARLETLSEAERRQAIPHGQLIWTAQRAFRRMLEHAWEHWLEISERLHTHE